MSNNNQLEPSNSASGSGLRFRRVQVDQIADIYFKDKICDEFKSSQHPLPDDIRSARNTAIIIGFIEMVMSIASLGFYIARRSRRSLVFILVTILATVAGFYAKLKLSYCGLLSHALYSISIIGGFYIYVMIDTIVLQDTKVTNTDEDRIKSNLTIIIICSLPLLGLFIMGMYSAYLLIKIDDELELRQNPPPAAAESAAAAASSSSVQELRNIQPPNHPPPPRRDNESWNPSDLRRSGE